MANKFGLPNADAALGKTDADIFSEEHAKGARDDEISSGVGTLRPLSLLEGWAFDLLGREQEGERSYESALQLLERELSERPDDCSIYAAVGLTMAGLGRKSEAIRAADRAVG